jgi:hypothetical protein
MTRFRRAGFWLFVVLIVISIGVVDWESYHAYERTDTSEHAEHYLDQGETLLVAEDFTTDNPLFPTTVYVEEGAVYRIMIDLQNAVAWKDLDIDGNAPNGFEPHWQHRWLSIATARFIRPRSDDRMFRLLASIGSDGHVIPIGPSASTSEFTAYTSGHLFIFVNDFPGFYANNRGSAKVRIERLD